MMSPCKALVVIPKPKPHWFIRLLKWLKLVWMPYPGKYVLVNWITFTDTHNTRITYQNTRNGKVYWKKFKSVGNMTPESIDLFLNKKW